MKEYLVLIGDNILIAIVIGILLQFVPIEKQPIIGILCIFAQILRINKYFKEETNE